MHACAMNSAYTSSEKITVWCRPSSGYSKFHFLLSREKQWVQKLVFVLLKVGAVVVLSSCRNAVIKKNKEKGAYLSFSHV